MYGALRSRKSPMKERSSHMLQMLTMFVWVVFLDSHAAAATFDME